MVEADPSEEPELAAGDFSSWMTEVRGAMRGDRASDVACDGCTACCTSSQFVHIGPDETDALARIPTDLLFAAPRLPRGHVLMGYDERGHCPMLVDGGCSIYEDRPRTCRTYDCRVFPAAGVEADADGDGTKVAIARRARRWRFGHPASLDRDQHAAVRAAATYLRVHGDLLPPEAVPATPTQLAVLAVEVHDAFLRRDGRGGPTTVVAPEPDALRAAVRRRPGDHGRS